MPNTQDARIDKLYPLITRILSERLIEYGVNSESYLDILSSTDFYCPPELLSLRKLICPVTIARDNQDWRALHALHCAGYACAGVLENPAFASL